MDLQETWNALGCTNGQTLNVILSGKSVRESESTKDAQHHTIHSLAGEIRNMMYASRLTPLQKDHDPNYSRTRLPYDRIEKRN